LKEADAFNQFYKGPGFIGEIPLIRLLTTSFSSIPMSRQNLGKKKLLNTKDIIHYKTMKNSSILLIIIIMLFLQNCHSHETLKKDHKIATIRKDSLAVKKDSITFSKIKIHPGKYSWDEKWNYFVADEIKKNMETFIDKDSIYKSDILRLCQSYYQLKENEKMSFWTLLIASIVKFESNFDTNCRFKEPPPLNTYSEGLMQLSYGDEKRYKNVPLDEGKKNILNAEVNLRTGVIIFAKQLEIKKTIFTNKHFYWSVLTNKQNEIIQFFKENIAEVGICK
jgi:hypothetical protein